MDEVRCRSDASGELTRILSKLIQKSYVKHINFYSLLSRASFHDFGPFRKLTAQNAEPSKNAKFSNLVIVGCLKKTYYNHALQQAKIRDISVSAFPEVFRYLLKLIVSS